MRGSLPSTFSRRAPRKTGSLLVRPPLSLIFGLIVLLALVVPLAACGGRSAADTASGAVRVVAGEDFWGSIAAQLGGTRVSVTSIISNPNTDPHEYASSSATARAFATAQYVILNGAGYDAWGDKLLAANPVSGRRVLTVASLLGKQAGDNPHFWYDPAYIQRVADRVTADYSALDPAGASYFTQQRAAFQTALQPYLDRIATIKASYAGQPVGSTESIFVYLADALGLKLISPPLFMQAVSEGNEPPAGSVAQFQKQILQRQIKALVYNMQAPGAVTTTLTSLAAQQHIPVVGISETIQPSGATFQVWQIAQLLALQRALSAGMEAA